MRELFSLLVKNSAYPRHSAPHERKCSAFCSDAPPCGQNSAEKHFLLIAVKKRRDFALFPLVSVFSALRATFPSSRAFCGDPSGSGGIFAPLRTLIPLCSRMPRPSTIRRLFPSSDAPCSRPLSPLEIPPARVYNVLMKFHQEDIS